MSKYTRLCEYLANLEANEWLATFDEVSKILRFPLPQSAYKYPAWWANQNVEGHAQSFGWRGAGWKTKDVDLGSQTVTFYYDSAPPEEIDTQESANIGLSMAEAKAGLAARFGVTPADVEIIIRG